MRGRRPRRREPWGERPNGPAKRYVRLFVCAILAVAYIGRLSVSSRGAANEAYYRSSADAWSLSHDRRGTLATVEDVVKHTHPSAVGAAQSTHVHLPGGGYLCAWVAGRFKSGASRPAVWASRRIAIEEAPLGDAEDAGDSGDGKSPWSAPFVLARAPGGPAAHRDPALFFADGVLRLHFRVGDEEDASPYATASTDGGETWSVVSSLRGEDAGETKSSARDSCAVGGTLPARLDSSGITTAIACVGPIDTVDDAAIDDAAPSRDGKGKDGVAVLVSADAGDRFARAARVACGGGTRVAAASLWRGAEASAAVGGKHITSLVLLGADGLVYRAESLDLGATWGNPERLDPETLDARAVPSGGVSVASVGRRALVMARVFFVSDDTHAAGGTITDANARVVVRLRLSDDGGATWPLWLDVPVPGGCAKGSAGSLPGGEAHEAFPKDAAETCARPVLEPWPELAEGFTLTRGAGGAGGIAFAATSVRAFRADASVGSDSDASSRASAVASSVQRRRYRR